MSVVKRRKSKKRNGPGMIAPPGQCRYCDRRREYIRQQVAALRKRKKADG